MKLCECGCGREFNEELNYQGDPYFRPGRKRKYFSYECYRKNYMIGYRVNNKEYYKEKNKEWFNNNKELCVEKARKFRLRNPDRAKEFKRNSYLKNTNEYIAKSWLHYHTGIPKSKLDNKVIEGATLLTKIRREYGKAK